MSAAFCSGPSEVAERSETMLVERSDRRGLWEADQLHLDPVGKDTFYGMPASLRSQLFRDTDLAELTA